MSANHEVASRPRRILILDDEPGVLGLLEAFLKLRNYEPVTTSRWTEAVDRIAHDPPDLLLLDLHMPTVQGEAVMEHIREQGNPFPVIVISAHLDEEKVAELTRLGVSACLGKPFQFEELEILMKRALGDSPKAEIADPPPRKATRPAMSPPTPGLPSRVPDPPPDPPAPPPHGRRDRTGPRPRSRSRKKTNWKLYFAVTAVCAIGAGVFIFLEFMSSRVSQGIDQAMEQTVQKEANRQRQELQNLSEKDKEALRQSVGRK